MILTTTPTIEGKIVERYLDVVGTEVIFGAMFLKDWIANAVDTWGGRNLGYEKVFEDARNEAKREIRIKAEAMGADAVLNLRFSYQVLGEKNGMMMVAATGSAVVLTLSREERKIVEAQQKANADAEELNHTVLIDGKAKGPFSKANLRALIESGRLTLSTVTVDADGKPSASVGEVLGQI